MGKATIYRRYRAKHELVTAAVAALVSEITVPDTGSTQRDLLELMLPSHDPQTAVRLAERRTVEAVQHRAAT